MNDQRANRIISNAFALLVDACGGCCEASVPAGVDKSYLSKCADPKYTELPNAKIILRLESYCGVPVYSREMAKRDLREPGGNVLAAAINCAKEAAEIAPEALEALRDGSLSINEIDRVQREAVEAQQALDSLFQALEGARQKHEREAA